MQKNQLSIIGTYNQKTINELIQRPQKNAFQQQQLVVEIFDAIKKNAEKALRSYTLKFDQVEIKNFEVSKQEMALAKKRLPLALKKAIEQAYKNIFKFHVEQKEQIKKVKILEGITCWRESRAIEKIGMYVPGGTAPLFSSVLMLGIPAQIAGCKDIILTTPPDPQGQIHDAILFAASLVGVTKIFKCGGIQAIASLTFGTENIPSVYKIVGPGNAFVTAAKLEAIRYGVAIDMPAGPSELMIVADKEARPEWVAADVLSQLEHGVDSQVIVVVSNQQIAHQINIAIQNQLLALPRKKIIEQSLLHSKIIIQKNVQLQINLINHYAPEHLILSTDLYEQYIPLIQNAGSVFLGEYSAEALGDYASGTNHTLPTNGYAKAYSGVSVDTFVKKITFQKITKKGIAVLGNTVAEMASAEQLTAHQQSVLIRMKSDKK